MRELILDPDWSKGRRVGLERAIRDAMRTGQLGVGSVLPSSRVLAADLGVSRATVVGAYEQLIAEGYLIGKPGTRTTVAKILRPEPLAAQRTAAKREWVADFLPGEPDGGLFPRGAWLRSLKRVLNEVPDKAFGYCSPRGKVELREELSLYLARSRAVLSTPENLNIVGGASGAVTVLGQMLARLGIDKIAVENPSLPILHYGMRLGGIDLVPIPVDIDGLCVDQLWASDAKAVLVTPSHQFPTGIAMSATRRVEIVEWARARQGWIIEDDYDGEFRYDRQPLGALQGIDPERVIYLGTASKALAPALRMAWIVVPQALQSTLAAARGMQSVTSTIDQLALADFIKRGEIDRHLRRTRAVYHRRHRILHDAVTANVSWLDVSGVDAGLHLTGIINDPKITEGNVVAALAKESVRTVGLSAHYLDSSLINHQASTRAASVPFAPLTNRGSANGQNVELAGERRDSGLVFGYSRLPEHSFPSAVERLVGVLRRQQ